MTTLRDSLLTGDCDDVRLRGRVKACQTIIGHWTESEAQFIWDRIAYMLQLWRATAQPFSNQFRGVNIANDACVLSRLIELGEFPIGDVKSPSARERILALGVLKSAARDDVEGALLLLVDLKDEQRLASSDSELARSQKVQEGLQKQLKTLEKMAPDFKRGRKVIESAKKGHEQIHGSPNEKEKRKADYQETVDALYKEHPHWKWTRICDEAGKLHRRSGRTIRNNTDNPIKAASKRLE